MIDKVWSRVRARIGDLEEPVAALAEDEGLVFERTHTGLRVRTHLRAGNDGETGNAGEGSGGTDRRNAV